MSVFCQATHNEGLKGNGILHKETIEGIDEWPHNWPDGEVSYRLNNFTTDIDKTRNQLRAVTVAFRVWQLRIKKLKFRRERNPDVHVDIDISFLPKEKFEHQGILARAYYPGQGRVSGNTEINDLWNWVTSAKHVGLNAPPLVPVLIHEFGHSLGLRHDTSTTDSIMYPSYSNANPINDLHPNDIQRIQSRYGVRSLPQRWIDRFRRRRDMAWDFT